VTGCPARGGLPRGAAAGRPGTDNGPLARGRCATLWACVSPGSSLP